MSFFCHSNILAQIEVTKPIILNGSTESDRQINNLGSPASQNDAINVYTLQKNEMRYNATTGTDSIFFSITPAIASYTQGLTIYFKAFANNTGPVTVNVNGIGNISVKKAVNKNLVSNDIYANEVLAIIYDGTNFQLVSEHNKSCPAGFSEVNKLFCIENDERAALSFFSATVACYSVNSRLCTWGEWYYACQKSGLGLLNMTNNYEWVDSATNESGYVRTAGSASCVGTGQGIATTTFKFRCCYSK